MLRSLLAVTAGYAALILIVTLFVSFGPGAGASTGPVTGAQSRPAYLALAVAFAAAAAGGWLTATLAVRQRRKHVQVLALLVAVGAGVIYLISAGGGPPGWFQLANAGVAVAGVLVGASLRRGSRL